MNNYLEKLRRLAFVFGGCLIFAAAIGANVENDKSITYDGSEDLPNGIAFQQFLLLVKSSYQDPDRVQELGLLSLALGKQADENGDFGYLLPRLEQLDRVRADFQREKILKSHEILCPKNRALRSVANSHAALNAIDDVPVSEGQRQLDLYMHTLSKREQASLKEYLVNIKRSTTYVRVDSSTMERDVTTDIENQCINLKDKKLAMGVE